MVPPLLVIPEVPAILSLLDLTLSPPSRAPCIHMGGRNHG
jgi:hypothetical protein